MAQKKAPLDPLEAAVQLIKDRGTGVPSREVLEAVADQVKIKTSPERSRFMAELHTLLCMDNRLVNVGGNWNMKDAAPKPKVRGSGLRATTLTVARRRKVEVVPDEEEDEEDPLIEEEAADSPEEPTEDDEGNWD